MRFCGRSILCRFRERSRAALLLRTGGWQRTGGAASGRTGSELSTCSRRDAPDEHHRIGEEFGRPGGIGKSLIGTPDRARAGYAAADYGIPRRDSVMLLQVCKGEECVVRELDLPASDRQNGPIDGHLSNAGETAIGGLWRPVSTVGAGEPAVATLALGERLGGLSPRKHVAL